MEKEAAAEWINRITAVQGDIQRAVIWLKRLYDDCERLKKECLNGSGGTKKDADPA